MVISFFLNLINLFFVETRFLNCNLTQCCSYPVAKKQKQTKHVYLSPITLASSPPMMSIYGSWSQECSQRGLNITLKPTLPLPSSLLGTWAPMHSCLSLCLSPLSLTNIPRYRIPEKAVDALKWRALSKCWSQVRPEKPLFCSLGWEEGGDQRG